MGTKRVEMSDVAPGRRVQITLRGAVLDYLEERGRSAFGTPDSFAARGLAYVLDEWLTEHEEKVRPFRERERAMRE